MVEDWKDVVSFGLTQMQLNQINEWRKAKNKEKYGKEEDPYGGAIGGALTYSFTPTSLGVVQKVKLSYIDEELDVTDYDWW